MDFTEIFKSDDLAAVLASAAVTVAAVAMANLTFAFLMAPDGELSGVSTLAPPGPLSACDLDAILFGLCYW